MQIAENMQWGRIYWVRGNEPRRGRQRYAVQDPPTSGWSGALVIQGDKRSTIFCPHELTAYSVPNTAAELEGMKSAEFNPGWFKNHMHDKWVECQTNGWSKDYDTAVMILKRLNMPIPEQIMKGGEEDGRARGGKEVAVALERPVKRNSKRGKFLEWFIDGNNSRPVREAMAEFSMTRSNALSYLYMLQKDHGIGYALVGDNANLTFPAGCTNPFDDETFSMAPEETPEIDRDEDEDGDEPVDDNDDWLEGGPLSD
jgi:hypothetical protein